MTNNNNELYNNLLETLKNSGQYDKLQAQTYQNIFEVLGENSAERPELPVENVLINSLIFDYLTYNQYDYSSKTLSSESGQDNFPSNTFRKDDDSKTLSRAELAKKLNISGDVHSKPILYGILEHFLAGRNENQMKN